LGRPGTAVVAGRTAHVVGYEVGAAALNALVQFHTVDDHDGMLDVAEVGWLVGAAQHHWLPVSAVFVENTHMHAGGVPWTLERLDAIAALGVPVHLDGARLFNAEVATGIAAAEYAARAATVTCCLSKGLGAPIGSLLAADGDLVAQARIERKRLGGGMRHAGVIAAPGLIALRDHVERLAEDHARARRLAEAVAERWPGALDPATVRTNVVAWCHRDPVAVVNHLGSQDVLGGSLGPDRLRLVTHLDVDDAGVDRACAAIATAP
jgi:threonine aldolase